MTTPVEHLEESLKLEADKPIDLWEIVLKNTSTRIYARYGPTVTWQGHEYQKMGIQLTEESEHADDQNGRPTLTVVNPDGLFGPFAAAGYLELATVYRRRVHQVHLNANANIYEQRVWFVGRIVGVRPQAIQLELRGANDIPNFLIPPRMYLAPEFPIVSY